MDNNLEEWKLIEDYPLYEVSTNGRIRNIKTQRILKPTYHWNGYLLIGIHKNGKVHTKIVHRLVAKAFINNPEDKPTVDHINGNKIDNRIENLRWATYKEQGKFNNHNGHCSEYKKEIMKRWRESHKDYMKNYYRQHKKK